MGFFEVGDGDSGAVSDRIAIVAIVCFAFSWIPVMIIWKLVTLCKARNSEHDVEKGNMPVTNRASKPKDHPQLEFDLLPVQARDNEVQQSGHRVSASSRSETEHQSSYPTGFARAGPEEGHVDKSNRQRLNDRQSNDFKFGPTHKSDGILNGSHATNATHDLDTYRQDVSRPDRASRRHQGRRNQDDRQVDEAEQSLTTRRPKSPHSKTSRSHRSRRAERNMNDHHPSDPLRIRK